MLEGRGKGGLLSLLRIYFVGDLFFCLLIVKIVKYFFWALLIGGDLFVVEK